MFSRFDQILLAMRVIASGQLAVSEWPRVRSNKQMFNRYVNRLCCVVLAVGCLAGSVASIIDIGAQWMTDLKYGLCGGQSSSTHSPSSAAAGVSNGSGGGGGGGGPQLWFNREQCCWASEGDSYSLDDCDEWLTWSELIGWLMLRFALLFCAYI